jgi:VanZ family protein
MFTIRRAVLFGTILFWVALFCGTHVPGPKLPKLRISDKTIHFTGYFLLASGLFWALRLMKPGWREIAATVLGICLLYGAVDEWTQALPFIRRTCDLADWFADAAGAGTAVVAMSWLAWWTIKGCARETAKS